MAARAITLVVLECSLVLASRASAWKRLVAAAPWKPRSDPQLAVLGDRLLLLGGHANNDYFNDCWSSADGGMSWEELPRPPWENRSYHTAKVHNGTLYMLGGHNANTWFNVCPTSNTTSERVIVVVVTVPCGITHAHPS